MDITIAPKDSVGQKLKLEEVETYFHSHGAFTFVFPDGSTRVYPMEHVWYVEANTD